MIRDMTEVLNEKSFSKGQVSHGELADAKHLAKHAKKALLDGTLRSGDLHLYGPVTRTYLDQQVVAAMDEGGPDAACKAEFIWWRANNFNHKCARDCMHDYRLSNAGVLCRNCIEANAKCYYARCSRFKNCDNPTCPYIHLAEVLLLVGYFINLGIWYEEALRLAELFWNRHLWWLPKSTTT